jgi:hypothetical protein
MIWKVVLLSIGLMALVAVLMSVTILIKKKGQFPNLHIGANKDLAKRGISCATTQDRLARKHGRAMY